MAYGMQVYRADGTLVVDIGHRLTRFVSAHTMFLDNASQDVFITGIADDGTWAVWADNMLAHVAIYTGYFRVSLKGPAGNVTASVLMF